MRIILSLSALTVVAGSTTNAGDPVHVPHIRGADHVHSTEAGGKHHHWENSNVQVPQALADYVTQGISGQLTPASTKDERHAVYETLLKAMPIGFTEDEFRAAFRQAVHAMKHS